MRTINTRSSKVYRYIFQFTHYTNTYEQQPYCVGTLSQMTQRPADRHVRQETGCLAGGPLLRVTTTRCTTDTFLFISHTTNVILFKFRCNILIGVRIIKEMPGLVTSGTLCIIFIPYLWLVVIIYSSYITDTFFLNRSSIHLNQIELPWEWRQHLIRSVAANLLFCTT
jgi:hypothetical protein